jgi:hypothetical protein
MASTDIQILPKFSNVRRFEFLAAHPRKWTKIVIIGRKAAEASQGYGISKQSRFVYSSGALGCPLPGKRAPNA